MLAAAVGLALALGPTRPAAAPAPQPAAPRTAPGAAAPAGAAGKAPSESAASVPVLVTADGTCPSAAAVQAELRPLLPSPQPSDGAAIGEEAPGRPRAHVEPLDELVRVEVRAPGGAILSVRDLERAASCADLAAAAAVVIASAIATAQATALQSDGSAAEVPKPVPAPSPVPSGPRTRWDLGVALLGAFAPATGAGATPAGWGGSLELQVAPRPGPLALRLALVGTAARRQGLGEGAGAADWTRLSGWLGARYRFPFLTQRLLLDVHAAALLGLVAVEGAGFAQNLRSIGFDVGLGGGLRLGVPWRWLLPHVSVTVAGWLRPHELHVVGVPEAGAEVPALDVQLGVGLCVGRWSL